MMTGVVNAMGTCLTNVCCLPTCVTVFSVCTLGPGVETSMPWQCAHCAKNNLGVGVYGLIRCSECGTSSPALTKCADLGLELLWVPADGDCYYHALLQAERARTNRPTNVNDAGYIMALTALRTEAAKQLTSSDAQLDVAQQWRVDSARRARHAGRPVNG